MNVEEALEFTDQRKVDAAVNDLRINALIRMMEDLGEKVPELHYQGPACELRVGSGDRGSDWIVEHYSDEQACACVFGLFTLTFGKWLNTVKLDWENKTPKGTWTDYCTADVDRINDFDNADIIGRVDYVFGVRLSQWEIARLVEINDGEKAVQPDGVVRLKHEGKGGRAAALAEFKSIVTKRGL